MEEKTANMAENIRVTFTGFHYIKDGDYPNDFEVCLLILKDRDIITSSIHYTSPPVFLSYNAVLLKIIHLILQLRPGFYIVRIDKAAPCLSECTWLLAAFRGI